MDSITVKNESGQVVSLGFDPSDPRSRARKEIVEGRIRMGELEKAGKSDESGEFTSPSRRAAVSADTGVKDEKGDYLLSVHGGGLDPDADGDALGQPTGSGHPTPEKDREIGESYIERTEKVETTFVEAKDATGSAAKKAASPKK